ncbi:MAG: ribonuclease III [bacterium]
MDSWFKKVVNYFFPFSKSVNSQLRDFEEIIGYNFKNKNYLKHALSHRSYVYSHDGTSLESNERLEFLGDAVLDLIVSDHLYHIYPEKREGTLSKYKSLIISRKVLKHASDKINLEKYIFLSDSEEKSGGRSRISINSDAIEAVIGAIYLDGGHKNARAFIQKIVLADMEEILKDRKLFNYKSILLEYFQSIGRSLPRYVTIEESGPEHNKTFKLCVEYEDKKYNAGRGKTKKDAEQDAARAALEELGVLSKNCEV